MERFDAGRARAVVVGHAAVADVQRLGCLDAESRERVGEDRSVRLRRPGSPEHTTASKNVASPNASSNGGSRESKFDTTARATPRSRSVESTAETSGYTRQAWALA